MWIDLIQLECRMMLMTIMPNETRKMIIDEIKSYFTMKLLNRGGCKKGLVEKIREVQIFHV